MKSEYLEPTIESEESVQELFDQIVTGEVSMLHAMFAPVVKVEDDSFHELLPEMFTGDIFNQKAALLCEVPVSSICTLLSDHELLELTSIGVWSMFSAKREATTRVRSRSHKLSSVMFSELVSMRKVVVPDAFVTNVQLLKFHTLYADMLTELRVTSNAKAFPCAEKMDESKIHLLPPEIETDAEETKYEKPE